MTHKTWMATVGAVAMVMITTGCQSTTTGNEGNLLFSYTADDDLTDFNKPVGIGAKLALRVFEAGTRREVTLTDAMSQDEGVLAIDSVAGNTFIIEGVGEGNTLLEVEAELPNGELVTDSVNMRAAAPEVAKLRHTCQAEGGRNALYLTGAEEILIPYDLELERGDSVIGYGLFPFEFAPAESITLNQTSTDQQYMRVDLGEMIGEITVSSTIDDETLTLTLVEEATIDGAELNPLSAALNVIVDESQFLHFWPTVGGERICQSKALMSATSLTPEVCEINAIDDADDSKIVNESNYVRITGKAIGNCEYEVTFSGGNGGMGATQMFTTEVLGGPGDPMDE